MTHRMEVNVFIDEDHPSSFIQNHSKSMICKISDAIIINNDTLVRIVIFPRGEKDVEIISFEALNVGLGIGTTYMNMLNEITSELGIHIYLIPGDVNNSKNNDPHKRRDFYHKHGFKRSDKSVYWINELKEVA